MAFDLYDRFTLETVFKFQKTPTPPFWLKWFGRQINFDTPEIYFDKVFGDDRGLAPFVIPTMQGRAQKLDPHSAVAFSPAYIKILDVVNPGMFINRQPGEGFGGSAPNLSLNQRHDAVIAELLRRGRVKIQNRFEWLAAKALQDGKVTISGEDYPTTTVDFRRDPALTAILTGTAKWDNVAGKPLDTLREMRLTANDISGARIRKFIFGANAWNLLTQRVDLRDMMDRNFGGTRVEVTLISEGYEGQEFMGVIAGRDGQGAIEAWVDTSKYIDPEDGQTKFYLDQNTVIGINEMVDGVRCFGAIMDARAGYQPMDVFFKNYENPNPSVEYLLLQSSPLMMPKNPNATFSVKVA